jgi:hypothetical protein
MNPKFFYPVALGVSTALGAAIDGGLIPAPYVGIVTGIVTLLSFLVQKKVSV